MLSLTNCWVCAKILECWEEELPFWCSKECMGNDPKVQPLPEQEEETNETVSSFVKLAKEVGPPPTSVLAVGSDNAWECKHKNNCKAHREICVAKYGIANVGQGRS